MLYRWAPNSLLGQQKHHQAVVQKQQPPSKLEVLLHTTQPDSSNMAQDRRMVTRSFLKQNVLAQDRYRHLPARATSALLNALSDRSDNSYVITAKQLSRVRDRCRANKQHALASPTLTLYTNVEVRSYFFLCSIIKLDYAGDKVCKMASRGFDSFIENKY